MNHKEYYFCNHIHGCIVDGTLIILDIDRDIYTMIDKNDLEKIFPYIKSTIDFNKSLYYSVPPENEINAILDDLVAQKVLTPDPAKGKILAPVIVPPPSSFFEQIQTDEWPDIAWHHIIVAFFAGVIAQTSLKLFSLKFIIFKLNNQSRPVATHGIEKALRLARIYHKLRPIMLKSRICLYDTLAFFCFCKFYGIKPTVVFGVTGDPFEAHCWAQVEDTILNDVPQYVKKFHPILSI